MTIGSSRRKNRVFYALYAGLITAGVCISPSLVYADTPPHNISARATAPTQATASQGVTWDISDFRHSDDGKVITSELTTPSSSSVTLALSESGVAKLKKTQALVIPEGVERIDRLAFNHNTDSLPAITSVTLPSTLKEIGFGAFFGNKIEGTLTVPKSVTRIYRTAFEQNNLKKVVLKNDTIELGERTFASNQISELEVDGSVTKIKLVIDKENRNNPAMYPFGTQELGTISNNLGSTFINPFTIKSRDTATKIEIVGFKENEKATGIENSSYFEASQDGKTFIAKKATGDTPLHGQYLTAYQVGNSYVYVSNGDFDYTIQSAPQPQPTPVPQPQPVPQPTPQPQPTPAPNAEAQPSGAFTPHEDDQVQIISQVHTPSHSRTLARGKKSALPKTSDALGTLYAVTSCLGGLGACITGTLQKYARKGAR